MKHTCPICSSVDSLREITYKFSARPVPEHSIDLNIMAMECSVCHEQIETPEQVTLNSKLINEAKLNWLANNVEKDKAVGTLVKELRSTLGVTQRKFSEMTGATGVSISKYELHTIKPSALATTLFTVLAKSTEARAALEENCGVRMAAIEAYSFGSPVITFNELIMGLDRKSINSTPGSASSIYTSVINLDNEFRKGFEVGELQRIESSYIFDLPTQPHVVMNRSTLLFESVH